MENLRFEVDVPEITVQRFLIERCGVSKRLLTKLKRCENGLVCNGVRVRSVDILKKGDIIVLGSVDGEGLEPNGNLNVPTAFENESLVVFDKPFDMPIHPSIKHQGDTLGNWFSYRFPELTFRPVNRLDKDTSGLCIVAKDPYAAKKLQGDCEKVYYAAVHGLTDESGTVNAPIAREKESIILRCVREDGQEAVTHYRRIAANDKYSLLEIHLETGRTHQIRVHFAHIGHPLAGDDMYGGSMEDISRQALHCGQLTFSLPMTGEKVTVKSDLPQDIKNLIK